MESPSDSVNGVNADVPSDNDGGEKVVRALLVDDSGSMVKHHQMDKSNRIIIPFPFAHKLHNKSEGQHQRMKRAISKPVKLLIGTAIVVIVSIPLNVVSYFMNKHIIKVGKNNISSGYKTTATVVFPFGIISVLIAAILFALSIVYNCIENRRRNQGWLL